MRKVDISVVMSVYNNEKFLARAITSILNQSFRKYEFIINDDASRDQSFKILEKYQLLDKRIKVFKNKKNKGLAYSLNKLAKKAKGKYIARMYADDFSSKNRLKLQLNFLKKNPKIDLLGTLAKSSDGKILTMPNSYKEIIDQIIKKNIFIHSTIMAKKNFFIKNKYNINYRKCQDYDLWIRTYRNHYFHNLDKILLRYNRNKLDINTVILTFKIMFLNSFKEKNRKIKSFYFCFFVFFKNIILLIFK